MAEQAEEIANELTELYKRDLEFHQVEDITEVPLLTLYTWTSFCYLKCCVDMHTVDQIVLAEITPLLEDYAEHMTYLRVAWAYKNIKYV